MSLSKFEKDVFEKLIERSPLREQLANQLGAASIVKREYSGVGVFIHFLVPRNIESLKEFPNFELSEVTMEIEGLEYGAGSVLFVRGGFLSMLEFFTYGEPWPDTIGKYQLSFIKQSNILTFGEDGQILHRRH